MILENLIQRSSFLFFILSVETWAAKRLAYRTGATFRFSSCLMVNWTRHNILFHQGWDFILFCILKIFLWYQKYHKVWLCIAEALKDPQIPNVAYRAT